MADLRQTNGGDLLEQPRSSATESRPSRTLTLVSTRTRDRVPQADGSMREMPGGPAHYVAVAFDRLECDYHLITGETVVVDVQRTHLGEQYVIPHVTRIPLPPRLAGDAVILSPVMQEIDPENVPPVDGVLIVDMQGFVRQPYRPTELEERQFDVSALIRSATVVKASESEVRRLTAESRDALRDTILLVTMGAAGVIVRREQSQHFVAARPVPVTHTIGAGDTFLAGFTYEFIQHMDPIRAAEAAVRFTEQVLRDRLDGNFTLPL